MTKVVRIYSPDRMSKIGYVAEDKEPFIDIECREARVKDKQ